MAPPSWAFQVEYFDPQPNEELICSICRCVFSEPVECPCHHVFCNACILKWLNIHRNCPVCRKRTYKGALHPVVPLIKNMIMKLTLHCKHNDLGCDSVMALENCENHIKICLYEIVECVNTCNGCTIKLLRKDIAKHELDNCAYRSIKCMECGLKILNTSSQEHNCVKELHTIIKERERTIADNEKKIKDLKEEVSKLSSRLEQQENRFSNASSASSSSSSSEDSIWSTCFYSSSESEDDVHQDFGISVVNFSSTSDDNSNDNSIARSEENRSGVLSISNDDLQSNSDMEILYFGAEESDRQMGNEDPSFLGTNSSDESPSNNTDYDRRCDEIFRSSVVQNKSSSMVVETENNNASGFNIRSKSPESSVRRPLKRRFNANLRFPSEDFNSDGSDRHGGKARSSNTSSNGSPASNAACRLQNTVTDDAIEVDSILSLEASNSQNSNSSFRSFSSLQTAVAENSNASTSGKNQSGNLSNPESRNGRRKACRRRRRATNVNSWSASAKASVPENIASQEPSLSSATNGESNNKVSSLAIAETSSGSQNSAVRRNFERTLSLLEQYNIESDPEWVPKSEGDSDSEAASSGELCFSSSSESSNHDNVDSDSSYEVKVPVPISDLLKKYCAEDSEDDPDWMP